MDFLKDSWMPGQRKRIGRENTRAEALFREFIAGCGIYIRARVAPKGGRACEGVPDTF
jgi:hypothetical protein